jgi:hypothetical protein
MSEMGGKRSFASDGSSYKIQYLDYMQVTAHLTSATSEAYASGTQVTNAVSAFVDEIAQTKPALANIDRLALCLVLSHPVTAPAPGPAKARYHAPAKTVYATVSADYEKWLDEKWDTRVEAVGEALIAAVEAVAKPRLTAEERATVVGIVRKAVDLAASSPPKALIPLGPVYLNFYPGSERPSVGFGEDGRSPLAERVVELRPSELSAHLESYTKEPETPPTMFKLYIRRGGRLEYHEAWIADGEIIEHWGTCGERGETRRHTIGAGMDPFDLLKTLGREPRAAGFKPMPPSRHVGLIVERHVEGFGSPEDLERRYELQAFLDDKLGWLGLGNCDGGSTGSGSMEAYCLVVDGAVALEALRRKLAASPFSDFRARLAPQGA